ncbi:hypothetical protein CHLNCDRAFT_142413 [Chlorella variabilis]|uniref:MYND-type domain-containing protein n=1 Tax=Chlorella variabilis TaxID=554065 RepID=E1Z725_CHLVA|nr:hypothetical protein CHLNCDRAFT_142413 [Chlorella variabilis]EFN58095.1 hypothetical protein CHLNCDRAFT_142413 [Chlorella variabilis]|eukprot:XP_005850197.1 hypothetical protein CHLNCDRAFT_142413 [Chlorella variabilis]
MAAMHQDELPDEVECANCGTTQNLLKCSRCHTAWFCGVKCQKAYWPFHRTQCKRNEFADAIEESEPKFARWMRKHGKQAVLKDDEVDRLERAGAAASGPNREDVMDSMYGRAEPKPAAPRYSGEELAAMRREAEAAKAAARLALQCGGSAAYAAVELPPQLSLDCQRYKWRQSQSHVEVFVPLPEGLPAGRVAVQLSTSAISVCVDEAPVLAGRLYREIKAEESTWYVQDGVLEVVMLKRCRRGNYGAGKTNADTFWRSVVQGAVPHETLPLEQPPIAYYSAPCEDLERQPPPRLTSGRAKQRAEAASAAVPPALTAA